MHVDNADFWNNGYILYSKEARNIQPAGMSTSSCYAYYMDLSVICLRYRDVTVLDKF